jgi:hypothetical protein
MPPTFVQAKAARQTNVSAARATSGASLWMRDMTSPLLGL